jgi:hypothetical protein
LVTISGLIYPERYDRVVMTTMDKFGEMMKNMMAMSEADRNAIMAKNKTLCICGGCPTYTDCAKGKKESLFCANGRSVCKLPMKACICTTCPITPMLGLTHTHFCIRGTEKDQRGM